LASEIRLDARALTRTPAMSTSEAPVARGFLGARASLAVARLLLRTGE
jgi:hypothetical protein